MPPLPKGGKDAIYRIRGDSVQSNIEFKGIPPSKPTVLPPPFRQGRLFKSINHLSKRSNELIHLDRIGAVLRLLGDLRRPHTGIILAEYGQTELICLRLTGRTG